VFCASGGALFVKKRGKKLLGRDKDKIYYFPNPESF